MESLECLDNFAKTLRKKRGKRTLRDMAGYLRIAPSTLQRAEHGGRILLSHFVSICSKLDLDPTTALGTPEDSTAFGESSTFDEIIRAANIIHPELMERTEQVAKIVDPGSFAEGWVIPYGEGEELFNARRDYMQAIARCRAQDILMFLGVNTDVDWAAILERMARDRVSVSGL